jgi:pentapeptide MXKDX repeat protein
LRSQAAFDASEAEQTRPCRNIQKEHTMTAKTFNHHVAAGVVFALASAFAAGPSFAADSMKADAMHSDGMKSDKTTGAAMKGDKMQGDAMKSDKMHGDSMKGDTMKGDK